MSNFDRAVKVLNAQGAYCGQCSREPGDSLDVCRDCAAVLESYAHTLEAAGLLAPDVQVIRTPEELEALARDDVDAIVLASEAGAVRTARALAAMHRLGSVWGLPAVVIATGEQVRYARETLDVANEW